MAAISFSHELWFPARPAVEVEIEEHECFEGDCSRPEKQKRLEHVRITLMSNGNELALSFPLKAFRNLVADGAAFLKAKDGAGAEA